MRQTEVLQRPPRLSVTVAEAADATGLSENYMRVLISQQRLPCVRVGRAVRVLVRDLEQFLESNRQGPGVR